MQSKKVPRGSSGGPEDAQSKNFLLVFGTCSRSNMLGPPAAESCPRGFQYGAKTAQDAPKFAPWRPEYGPSDFQGPVAPHEGFKTAQRDSRDDLRRCQTGQESLKTALQAPRKFPEAPERPQEASKKPPRGSQEAPRRPQEGPKGLPRGFQDAQTNQTRCGVSLTSAFPRFRVRWASEASRWVHDRST